MKLAFYEQSDLQNVFFFLIILYSNDLKNLCIRSYFISFK